MIFWKLRLLPAASGIVLLIVIVAGAVVAQTPTGAIVGTVTDAQGARVAGAAVSVQDQNSSFKRQTTANADGEFRLESLLPGNYKITVSTGNFAPSVYYIKVGVASAPTWIRSSS